MCSKAIYYLSASHKSDNNADGKRDLSLDIVRVLACLMVILMHSPYPTKNAIGVLYAGVSYITTPCIGLFFMVSGATLLPSKLPMFEFLKRRLNRILWPTLIWTLIYIILNNVMDSSHDAILKQLLSIPFSPQGSGVLWFMYTITAMYLISPIISPWLEKAKDGEILFVLSLCGLTFLYPILRHHLVLREDCSNILYYFSGYIGYFIAGYYLKRRKPYLSQRLVTVLFVGSLAVPILFRALGSQTFNIEIFGYLGPFCPVMTVCLFYLITSKWSKTFNGINNNPKIRGLIYSVSTLSFGVYLVHIAVMRFFLWNQNWFTGISNCVLQLVISFGFTFIVSYLIVYLIYKTPASRYVIGV